MFFATFFNVAFYSEILSALEGQPVSIGRGLKFAGTKLTAILMWSLLAGIVGLVIKTIEERLGFIGQIVMRFVGAAWSIASVFAIPIIVREDEATNPLTALRRSAAILKRTWGEALIGYVGFGLVTTVIVFGFLASLIASIFVSVALEIAWIGVAGAALSLLGLVTFAYVSSVAGQVYRGALYLYAANGTVVQPYSREMFDSAWKYRKS
jgi:hypothetical protein